MSILSYKRKLLPLGSPQGGGGKGGSGGGGSIGNLGPYGGQPSYSQQQAAPQSQASAQQLSAQNSPMQQSQFGIPPSSVYTSSFSNMPPPPSGGKSLGGVGNYPRAPEFGQADAQMNDTNLSQQSARQMQSGMTNQPQDPNAGQGLLQAFQGNFSPEARAFQQANPQPQPSFYDAIIGRATSDMQQQQSQNQMPYQQIRQNAQQLGGFNQPSRFGQFQRPMQQPQFNQNQQAGLMALNNLFGSLFGQRNRGG